MERLSESSSLTPPSAASTMRAAPRCIRLHFAGRDLPEPDIRSKISYATVYYAEESVATDELSTLSDCTPSKAASPQLIKSNTHTIGPHKASRLRAPHLAEPLVASSKPETYVTEDGKVMSRTAWAKLGTTELARKHGRDVEFARAFQYVYTPGTKQVLRVAFFDCTSRKVEKQRLIGVGEIGVEEVVGKRGKGCTAKLKFLAVTERDGRKKIPEGTLVVVGEIVKEGETFRLDVECNKIVRAKSLGSATVKRAFYTVHAVLDKEEDSDEWTLIYRSGSVEMIHRKRDGGSLEYSYFTSRRLKAGPGIIIEDTEEKMRRTKEAMGRHLNALANEESVLSKVGRMVGVKSSEMFFSLPGADLELGEDGVRLKLSLFEDNGLWGGFDLIAETEFSMKELREWELGMSSPIRIHANVVGKAMLKYVECEPNPKYFCLSLMMQGLR